MGFDTDAVGNVTLMRSYDHQYWNAYWNVSNSLERVNGNLFSNIWSVPARIHSTDTQNIGGHFDVGVNGSAVTASVAENRIIASVNGSTALDYSYPVQVSVRPTATSGWSFPVNLSPKSTIKNWKYIEDVNVNSNGQAVVIYRELVHEGINAVSKVYSVIYK